MRIRVYIGASSSQIDRVRAAEAFLRTELPDVEIMSTWPDDVERLGDPNPRTASEAERSEMAYGCLRRVDASDIMWFLVPPVDVATRGAWCEFQHAHTRKIPCVASGDTGQSVFCALALETRDDLSGARWVARLATMLQRMREREVAALG
jgi:hypothetical protein